MCNVYLSHIKTTNGKFKLRSLPSKSIHSYQVFLLDSYKECRAFSINICPFGNWTSKGIHCVSFGGWFGQWWYPRPFQCVLVFHLLPFFIHWTTNESNCQKRGYLYLDIPTNACKPLHFLAFVDLQITNSHLLYTWKLY